MATYVIGDIQGCFDSLQSLLREINFSPSKDELWLLGDLVNRGPKSLEVLRWAFENQDRIKVILGNHDLHLISRYLGVTQEKPLDSLNPILEHEQASQWIPWLRQQKLVMRRGGHAMVHGGVLPGWKWEEVERWARDCENLLQGPQAEELLAQLPGKKDIHWPPQDSGIPFMGAFLKVLTRLRVCDDRGRIHFGFSGPPEDSPHPFRPWYEGSHRLDSNLKIYFGHWSALGWMQSSQFVALDTGCVWGGELTALCLEDGRQFQVPAQEG